MDPWWTENNKRDFEHMGLKCAMRRAPPGHWCGYVGLPKDHPFYGVKDYFDPELEVLSVHGGITYLQAEHIYIDEKGLWWIGFDCSHFRDLRPKDFYKYGCTDEEVYRDEAYTEAECKELAEQLSKIATDKEKK